jgi:hypothetical protein
MQDGIGRRRMPLLVRHEALKHFVMAKVEIQVRRLPNFIGGVGAKLGGMEISALTSIPISLPS